MTSVDIRDASIRASLPPRREPHWHYVSDGQYISFRKMSAAGSGTWLARKYVLSAEKRYSYQALGVESASFGFDAALSSAQEFFNLGLASRRVDYITHLYDGWRQHLRKVVGVGPGVYLAYNGELLLYVGMSARLADRIEKHHRVWMSASPGMWPTHFGVIDTDSEEQAERIEAELIERHRPPLNRRFEQKRAEAA